MITDKKEPSPQELPECEDCLLSLRDCERLTSVVPPQCHAYASHLLCVSSSKNAGIDKMIENLKEVRMLAISLGFDHHYLSDIDHLMSTAANNKD